MRIEPIGVLLVLLSTMPAIPQTADWRDLKAAGDRKYLSADYNGAFQDFTAAFAGAPITTRTPG